jgi:hypothetical protein
MSDNHNVGLVFEYQYRDAGNFKVQGRLPLSGLLSEEQKLQIIQKFEDNEYFIAEQIGVPPLYGALYELSGGPTDEDHVWHEFTGFQSNAGLVREDGQSPTKALDFLNRVLAVENWKEELSPHWSLL